MSDEPSPAVRAAMEAIRRYLAQHPVAADSAQGVAQWWLPSMGLHSTAEQVSQALERLWRSGAIGRTPLPGGGVVYGSRPLPLPRWGGDAS